MLHSQRIPGPHLAVLLAPLLPDEGNVLGDLGRESRPRGLGVMLPSPLGRGLGHHHDHEAGGAWGAVLQWGQGL